MLAELSWRDLVPEIWLPDPTIRRERELARFRLHLVRHRTTLKNRIHATLIAFGHPCPVSDLFGHAGRELLDRLAIPDPWRRNVDVSLGADRRPRAADRRADRRASRARAPITATSRCWSPRPGSAGSTPTPSPRRSATSSRFASPAKLCGYTGLCPRVYQSGASDRRGPISKQGPRYLRWALFEAALNACKHPVYAERYQRTKRRLGRQRGPKVAQIDLSRKLTEAIWHMLTRNQPFAPAGAPFSSSRLTALFGNAPPDEHSDFARSPHLTGR